MEELFSPKSIAIVGASEEAGKIGNIICKNLLELGYSGEIFFVNQNHDQLFGKKCYKNLTEIQEKIDLAIIAIPAKFVNEIVKNGSEKIKNYVIISAGFSETDKEGKKREQELEEIGEKNQLNILGPNCLGFIAPKIKLNASFASGIPKTGKISFVSQSGALISAMMDISVKESFGFSHIISIGNKMDIDETKMLEFLADDPETKVIGMYLEGIKNGKAFMEVVTRVSKIKPVVILKAGKSEKAQIAIASHTGALAGSDEIMDAVFAKCGVIRAEGLDEFFGLLKVISNLENVPSKEVAVITNAGGAGVLTTDAFSKKKIELGEISEEIKKEMKIFLPAESSVENPVDLLGDALEDRYQKVLESLEKQTNLNSIVAVLTPQNQTPVDKIAQVLVDFKKKSSKNLIAVFIGGQKIENAKVLLNENGIAVFAHPEEAVTALDKFYFWQMQAVKKQEAEEIETNLGRQKNALAIIKKAQSEGRKALLFSEASELFSLYDLRSANVWTVESGQEPVGNFNFPVVVKVDSDQVLHKSDQEALILNINNEQELYTATAKISANFPHEKIIIQEMVKAGTEIICGIKKDVIFGSVIVFGLGGIYTEVFRMINLLVPPMGKIEIQKLLEESRLEFLFKGARGQKAYNLQELAEILGKMQNLALEIPEISELDVNPLFIYNNGKSAVAVDIKVIF